MGNNRLSPAKCRCCMHSCTKACADHPSRGTTTSMRIHEKQIPPIRLVPERHLIPHPLSFLLAHSLHPPQRLLIPFIQGIIEKPQRHNNNTQRRQCSYDTDFPRSIPWRFAGLEGLRADYLADAARDEGQCVGGYFFGVPRDVGCVPGEEEHECCAECAVRFVFSNHGYWIRRNAEVKRGRVF